MANNDKDNDCLTLNNYIIFIIFCIIIVIVIISLFILAINIINYILFTVYCINDNATDYLTEDPSTIILGSKYKYRLINYIKNIHDQNSNNNVYNVKNKYDYMSSDLYIHTTIEYYNYIVKLLLTIIFIICVGLLYNMFNIIITVINDCNPTTDCEFILSNIYNENTYIYYIIILIILFIGIHSYIYTYVFNQNIYKDLYDVYIGKESNYKISDNIILNIINDINFIDDKKANPSSISQYLDDLKNLSYDNIQFSKFLDKNNLLVKNADLILVKNADLILKKIINNGLIINNKFIIPTELEAENNTNKLFMNIYETKIISISKKEEELLANKIFLYLIYHYVISYNREDPYILHKLNNIYLHIFENIYNIYIEEERIKYIEEEKTNIKETAPVESVTGTSPTPLTSPTSPTSPTPPTSLTPVTGTSTTKELIDDKTSKYVPIDKLVLLEKFNSDIKKMYDQINCSYTIKYLLPVNTKKENLLLKLHNDADLILQYIYKYNENKDIEKFNENKNIFEELKTYKNIIKDDLSPEKDKQSQGKLYNLKLKIKNKIIDFTEVFSDYYQENKTLGFINTIIYKINFYLAAEMMQVIIFILLVLFTLYKSKKYPFLENYINMSIVYSILIINEVISAILGII
jgi:hypothetical protein